MVNLAMRAGLAQRLRAAEGFLMEVVRVTAERIGQPGYLRPEDLSPHLRRDVGLHEHRADLRPRP
jgi:hypothetical protein